MPSDSLIDRKEAHEHLQAVAEERALEAKFEQDSRTAAERRTGQDAGSQAIGKHFGGAHVSKDSIEFARPEQLCALLDNCDQSKPQSPRELADGIDKAASTNDYQESDKQLEKAVQQAFAEGGLPAVQKLEMEINRSRGAFGVKFDYPHSRTDGLDQQNLSFSYLKRLSPGEINDLSRLGILHTQLPKDALGNPGIIYGSRHEIRLYKEAPPGVHE